MFIKSFEEEWKKVQEEIRDIETAQHDLHMKWNEAYHKKGYILSKYILETGLLSKHPWRIVGGSYLECTVLSSEWEELSQLAETNYHCSQELTDGIRLRFDDSRITIDFEKGLVAMAKFIKDYKLTISKSFIADKIKKLKEEILSLEEANSILNKE